MIQEIWSKRSNAPYNVLEDWLKRFAAAHAKSDLVVDAYGALPETGNEDEFNRTYVVLTFESLATREQYYKNGVSEEVKAIREEGEKKQLTAGRLSHYYLKICK